MSAFALESREFLSTCLREALEDPDLVDAISDQALEHGLTALSIGQGMVTVDQLKDKLYLTIEEAKAVLNICASMVDGGSCTYFHMYLLHRYNPRASASCAVAGRGEAVSLMLFFVSKVC